MIGDACTLYMNGRLTPEWVNTQEPEATRGTRILRTVDPNLIVGFVQRAPSDSGIPDHSFVMFGPSTDAGGWVPICVCKDDDGRIYRAPVPWERFAHTISLFYQDAERGKFQPEKVAERNAERIAAADRADSERVGAAVEYAEQAIRAENEGASRHSPQDVLAGYHAANESRKPAPVGQVISIAKETP